MNSIDRESKLRSEMDEKLKRGLNDTCDEIAARCEVQLPENNYHKTIAVRLHSPEWKSTARRESARSHV